jgi:hypothetical protein
MNRYPVLMAALLIAAGVPMALAERWGPLRPGSRWWQALLFWVGFGVVICRMAAVFALGLQGVFSGTILFGVSLVGIGALAGALWWLVFALSNRPRPR